MRNSNIILSILFVSILLGQYEYNLDDINTTSETYDSSINPVSYIGQVTLHYFGHQN